MRFRIRILFIFTLMVVFSGLFLLGPKQFAVAAQQPTGSIPTVTGSPSGPVITVTSPDGARVRAGPNSVDYPSIGFLTTGQTAPALGRSPQGEWIQIYYPGVPGDTGWIYAPLVSLSPGYLPIVEPPPTTTPQITPTIDPTLAAAFAIPLTPTRLPTFTPPTPLAIATFTPVTGSRSGIPMGLVIFGLGFIGAFGALISFLRNR